MTFNVQAKAHTTKSTKTNNEKVRKVQSLPQLNPNAIKVTVSIRRTQQHKIKACKLLI